MLSRAISIILGSSCIGYEGCGGLFCSVAVKRAGHPGIGLTRFWTTGFRYPASCTLIPHSASTPLIQGGSRMRRRARTVLCGGRSAMVVPTATGVLQGTTGRRALFAIAVSLSLYQVPRRNPFMHLATALRMMELNERR